MSLDTERCGRCGAALVSMEADPEAIRAIRCRRCVARAERDRARLLSATIAGTTLVAALSAWQMLTA